jgi:uncharacterized integral membrane protein
VPEAVEVREPSQRQPAVARSGVILGVIVTVLIGALIAQNTAEVSVRWLFLHGKQPLWAVLAIAAVAGVVLDKLFGLAWRHRHHS